MEGTPAAGGRCGTGGMPGELAGRGGGRVLARGGATGGASGVCGMPTGGRGAVAFEGMGMPIVVAMRGRDAPGAGRGSDGIAEPSGIV